jgi:hypothetical protein
MKRSWILLGIVMIWAVPVASVLYGQEGTAPGGASGPAAATCGPSRAPADKLGPEPQNPPEREDRASPVGTAFTYQGQLKVSGSPANGQYDMRFKLYDDLGVVVAGPICVDNVACTDGLFTVEIDFGAQFGGDARELEIAIRPGGPLGDCAVGAGYTTLSPRQSLTATPYALGLRLPYAGAASVNGNAFSITNSNTNWYIAGIRGIQGGTADFGTFMDKAGVRGESNQSGGAGVLGISDEYIGVVGYSAGDDATATLGRADGVNGIGVRGWATDSGGIGVEGEAWAADGWAGYFTGRGYFSGNVGIGTTTPATKLDVNGAAKMTGFQLPTGAAAGRVLTSDASGNGSWQTPGPYATYTSGYGADPDSTSKFLSPTVTVTITAGQKIFVTANKAFGSTAAGGAASLNLYIGYRVSGSGATPSPVGGGIYGNRVPQNTRIPMGLSAVISGLSAGSYEVGLTGTDNGDGNWNSNEYGYVSVLVLN